MEDVKRIVAKPYHDIDTPFSVDERGAIAEYVLNDPENMPELALGSTIVIADVRQEADKSVEFWYSGRIIGLKVISPFSPKRTSMLYQADVTMDPGQLLDELNGPHTHQPMVIQTSLSLEWSSDEQKGHASAAIQRPPSGHSRLFSPNLESVENDNSPTLRTVLGVKESGLDLGVIGFGNRPYGWRDGEFIRYRWDIEHLDNKHIFIVGESGSGKTVFLKNLAFEIKKSTDARNRVIMTDVQGDITQLLFWDLVPRVMATDWRPEVTDKEYADAQKVFGTFRLIIPRSAADESGSDVAALAKLANSRGIEVRRMSLRFQDLNSPSEVEYLYKTTSDQVGMLLDDLADGVKGSGEVASLSRLQTALSRLLSRNSSSQITLPTNNVSYARSTFEAARRVLHGLEEYFDMDLEALQVDNNPLEDFEHDGTTILYLDHLTQDERFMWEMQLVNWLYLNKRKMENTYAFFDEAHQIIPRDKYGVTGRRGEVLSRLRSNFERLAREGRKFRINLVLSTQSPEDLHPIVPEQCPTRVVMKVNPQNAKIAGLDSGLALIANSFNHGEFWIQSPFNGTPDWIRVHGMAAPVPHLSMDRFRTILKEQAVSASLTKRRK